MDRHTAYISVGSNIGNKLSNCRRGMSCIESSGLADIVAKSSFYKTEPVDYRHQDWFVNAVFQVDTIADPHQLFDVLKTIEIDQGRDNDSVRFGPRVLDLDIILYDDLVMDSSVLTIPHPRMHKRRFVLKPFCDIAPHVIHPVLKKTMQQLLESLPDTGQKVILNKCD
ncbi:2-amino-4-hydroxy-6-hydroxymethyldihydropteridine diphosphokinase [Thermodesulfobacteriota bacterium]